MDLPRNAFKHALAEGRQQIGLWVSLASPYAAEVVAGSARCFGKTGEGCTTSTSIAGGALLPGPGSVISIGSMAATQSPCTAPAPSTQSGRVIERLSVKGRSFRGAAALPPPTSASS